MFDKARRAPWPGSPMERLYLLVWQMRQEIEYQKSRATVQALALLVDSQEKAKIVGQSFSDLRKACFPYEENQEKQDKQNFARIAARESARGPIGVVPLNLPKPHQLRRQPPPPATKKRPAGAFSAL